MHDHSHDHTGHSHSHAPKDFGFAFALGTALNLGFVGIEAIFIDVFPFSLGFKIEQKHTRRYDTHTA